MSIPKSIDPHQITMEEAEKLLAGKVESTTPIHDFGDILVLNGRYGAYLRQGDTNYKLPKGTDVAALTREKCEEVLAKAAKSTKEASFRRKK